MRVIGITGKKNTGKTTLVTMLIPELIKKGYTLGTIKKTHSQFDIEGRDTEKHSVAGAKIVAGVGKETFFKLNKEMELEDMLKFMKELETLDFVILEGFKESPYIKIATADYDNSDDTILKVVDVRKISGETSEIDSKNLDDCDTSDSIKEIIELIEDRSYGILQKLNCKKCGYNTCDEFRIAKIKGEIGRETQCFADINDAVLKVDGELIPMNPFVTMLVRNITTSIVDSLRTNEFGAKSIEKIELIVKNETQK
ncbi:MAG: molybdopterin-guanine dinucleotide biosynthesis protein B [Methanobrevibacter sp.]|nr:molybdopterin-guanine dinucleotide biosynthesis protein B [Methanobrevibacter sp.]